MICKTEPDDQPTTEDDESPQKNKKKDPNKVEKKFLMPHGLTPPCKNVRKKRFRKTLKKKYVEAPEIEKEVKRLLRTDNEAVTTKWELVDEAIPEEELEKEKEVGHQEQSAKSKLKDSSMTFVKLGKNKDQEAGPSTSKAGRGRLDEHDIFGEEVSDSDEDDEANLNTMDLDESHSRLSADDSRMSSGSMLDMSRSSSRMAIEFQKNMFSSPRKTKMDADQRNALLFGNDDDSDGFKVSVN